MTWLHGDITREMEKIAPLECAESWDSVGYHVGSSHDHGRGVVLALDPTREVIRFTRDVQASLLITHHPLCLDKPVRKINPDCYPGREIHEMIRSGISLYVAHTNLDSSRDYSMNAEIGRRLPLKSFCCKSALFQGSRLKLVTFAPGEHVERICDVLAQTGAGVIGEYTHCAFTTQGKGTFLGSPASHPVIGSAGKLEKVEEVRIEMICPKERLDQILQTLRQVHPYEEVAYDLYPLEGYAPESRFIWVGELKEEMPLVALALLVQQTLGQSQAPVRYAGSPEQVVHRIAWCSGGGKSLLSLLSADEVDVFITGDTGHHDALLAKVKGLSLIDIDHYWTEQLFVDLMYDFLTKKLGEAIPLHKAPGEPLYHGVG
jgi:dinuclear metal center YbgI/SA1388 family protein